METIVQGLWSTWMPWTGGWPVVMLVAAVFLKLQLWVACVYDSMIYWAGVVSSHSGTAISEQQNKQFLLLCWQIVKEEVILWMLLLWQHLRLQRMSVSVWSDDKWSGGTDIIAILAPRAASCVLLFFQWRRRRQVQLGPQTDSRLPCPTDYRLWWTVYSK